MFTVRAQPTAVGDEGGAGAEINGSFVDLGLISYRDEWVFCLNDFRWLGLIFGGTAEKNQSLGAFDSLLMEEKISGEREVVSESEREKWNNNNNNKNILNKIKIEIDNPLRVYIKKLAAKIDKLY